MIQRTFLACMGLVGTVFATACGDDEAPADRYPTTDSFCAAKAAAECGEVAGECTVSDDTCESARKSSCMNAAGAATAQGRTYQPGSAQECIDRTTLLYGDRVLDVTKLETFEEACERVFMGAKKRSEACTNAYDCEGTLVCDKGFCADEVAKRLKDPCNNPGDVCDTGLFCQVQSGARFCAEKGTLGANCGPELPCLENLRCNSTSCVALMNAGDPCNVNDDCSTHYCNPDKKCQALRYASETGTCKDFGGN